MGFYFDNKLDRTQKFVVTYTCKIVMLNEISELKNNLSWQKYTIYNETYHNFNKTFLWTLKFSN